MPRNQLIYRGHYCTICLAYKQAGKDRAITMHNNDKKKKLTAMITSAAIAIACFSVPKIAHAANIDPQIKRADAMVDPL